MHDSNYSEQNRCWPCDETGADFPACDTRTGDYRWRGHRLLTLTPPQSSANEPNRAATLAHVSVFTSGLNKPAVTQYIIIFRKRDNVSRVLTLYTN